MGNCMSNSGSFEPPGSKAVSEFISAHDKELDPNWIALKAAERRAAEAEKAGVPTARTRHKGPKCSICKSYVDITINPWQLTRGDLLSLDISDDSDAESDAEGGGTALPADAAARKELRRSKLKKRGIELKPCKHVFCGACLAQSIYRNLKVAFNPADYGTKLASTAPAPLGGKLEFPMGCPTCQVKPGETMVEITDMTARLVLGDGNMDEWNHARYMSTLDIIYCPYKGCNEAFDANDIAPTPTGGSHVKGLVQCPRCHKSLCKDCKVIWHDKLTCEQYQALPPDERAPEDRMLVELAAKEKWRRCPKCNAMVELKYGCNHITCTCKHHFCYACGADFQYKNGQYKCTNAKSCKLWDEDALLERR